MSFRPSMSSSEYDDFLRGCLKAGSDGAGGLARIADALERIASVLEGQQSSAAAALKAEHERLKAVAEQAARSFGSLDNQAIRGPMTDWERQRHLDAEERMDRAYGELHAFESAHPELKAQVQP